MYACRDVWVGECECECECGCECVCVCVCGMNMYVHTDADSSTISEECSVALAEEGGGLVFESRRATSRCATRCATNYSSSLYRSSTVLGVYVFVFAE